LSGIVYLDVVGFTRKRSVEAQADVVAALNQIVSACEEGVLCKDLINLPTGDGMAICMVGDAEYDAHISLALNILNGVAEYNEKIMDPMRKFEVRIGIGQNLDNIFKDINDNLNVAGSGINTSARVMDFADGSQILISSAVKEVLSDREKYM
jgi:class 3 adenylate cyclase